VLDSIPVILPLLAVVKAFVTSTPSTVTTTSFCVAPFVISNVIGIGSTPVLN
jgi:hypothetical protein